MQLESTQGLELLPAEILQQGTEVITKRMQFYAVIQGLLTNTELSRIIR